MRIFNETKTVELTEVDYTLGYLKLDKLFMAQHEAIPFKAGKTAEELYVELKEQGVEVREYGGEYYRVLESYDEGAGEDLEQIEAEPDTQAAEAWDEYEDIQVYVPYTSEELKERADNRRHAELKFELEKIKEDIEQETFGLVRDDYAEKRARAAEIINELRVLEGKEPREVTFATAGSNDLK